MLPSFCRETVTVSRAPLAPVRGSRERDWSKKEDHYLTGCSVQPVSSAEATGEAREGTSVAAALYAPPGADVAVGDRVTSAGQTFEVVGSPLSISSPTGAVSHVRCDLARYVG